MFFIALGWSLGARAQDAYAIITEKKSFKISGKDLDNIDNDEFHYTNGDFGTFIITCPQKGIRHLGGLDNGISTGSTINKNEEVTCYFKWENTKNSFYEIHKVTKVQLGTRAYGTGKYTQVSLNGADYVNIGSLIGSNTDVSTTSDNGLTNGFTIKYKSTNGERTPIIANISVEYEVQHKEPLFYFSSMVFNSGGGTTQSSVTKSMIQGDMQDTFASTTATFTATSNEGYMFKGWGATADATTYESTENPYTVTITNNTPGSTANKTLYAIFDPIENTPKTLILNSTTISSYEPDTYETVTLERTLKAGYNTLALPLDTDVKTLTGRENEDDWVAQLSLVTENAKDGYTLFFQKVENGQMEANLPYILHLASDVVNPQWTDMEVKTAEPVSTNSIKGWTMSSNYEAGKNMEGLYGIVNATPTETNQGGCLMLGASGSTLAPFMAYIVGPSPANKVKVAYIDDATDIKQVTWMDADEVEGIYTSSGIRLGKEMRSGLNIVRMKSGKVKKLWVK